MNLTCPAMPFFLPLGGGAEVDATGCRSYANTQLGSLVITSRTYDCPEFKSSYLNKSRQHLWRLFYGDFLLGPSPGRHIPGSQIPRGELNTDQPLAYPAGIGPVHKGQHGGFVNQQIVHLDEQILAHRRI